jgi:sodium/bile acid cotransporter 7
MGAFLRRRWFLILLLVGVVLALLATEAVGAVLGPVPARWVVAGTLFLTAWGLESHRLWEALTRPGPALTAVAVSYGLLPALGLFTGTLFPLTDFRLGLLVAATVPCTLASAAIWTRLAGGNEATALLVTILTNSTSWLATTAWLTLTTGADVRLDPGRLMGDLILFLVLPIALGQLARGPTALRYAATRGKIALSVLARLLILLIILQAVVRAAEEVRGPRAGGSVGALAAVALACLGLHLAGLAAGLGGSRLLGFDRGSQIAVAFAGSQKSLPIGLFVLNTYFAGYALAVVPMLFYHVGQLLVDTVIADVFRGKDAKG